MKLKNVPFFSYSALLVELNKNNRLKYKSRRHNKWSLGNEFFSTCTSDFPLRDFGVLHDIKKGSVNFDSPVICFFNLNCVNFAPSIFALV